MTDEQKIVNIPLSEILTTHYKNYRGKIRPVDVVDLIQSIEASGLITPVAVKTLPLNKQTNGKKYALIAGFRRTEAHIALNKETIQAVIQDHLSDSEIKIANLMENVTRKDLNILQEAYAIKDLIETQFTLQNIAKSLGKPLVWVQLRHNLLKLPEAIQKDAGLGILTQQQIADLYNLYKTVGNKGEHKLFDLVKKIKDRKRVSDKLPVTIVKKPVDKAVQQDKNEIRKMLNYMQESIGNGLHTRVCAWALGFIPTIELFIDIKEYATRGNLRADQVQEDLEKLFALTCEDPQPVEVQREQILKMLLKCKDNRKEFFELQTEGL